MDAYQLKTLMEQNPDAKLKDLVQQLLYDEIINLRLAPGTKLNVNQLAAQLGISRTPVVEAVAGLGDIGFTVSRRLYREPPGRAGQLCKGAQSHGHDRPLPRARRDRE